MNSTIRELVYLKNLLNKLRFKKGHSNNIYI